MNARAIPPRPASFREVLALWGSLEAVVEDLNRIGLKPRATIEAVRKWWQRDSIAGEFWLPLVVAAVQSEKKLDIEDLARIGARTMKPARRASPPKAGKAA